MGIKKRLSRYVSGAAALGMTLSYLAYAPLAFAAPILSFEFPPSDQYKVYEPGLYTVTVDLGGYLEDTTVDFYVRGPIGETSEEEHKIETYQYIASGSHDFDWDGKFDGEEYISGIYELRLEGVDLFTNATNELKHQFNVVYEAPVFPDVTDLGVTINPFSPDSDGQQDTTTVTFNTNTEAAVTVRIKNTSGVEVRRLIDESIRPAGQVNTVWNGREVGGSVLPDGAYTVEVTAATILGEDVEETEVVINTAGQPQEEEPQYCAGFNDLPANYSDCEAIEFVKSIGAMTGNPDGTFRPDDILQRDQVAKISLETFGLFDESADYCAGDPAFPDVPESQWSYQYICRGVDLGMITGYESGADAGKYVPARSVNRVEFLALILRNVSDEMPSNDSTSYNDVEPGTWFSGYAKYSLDNSLFVGTELNPSQYVTRLEVAKVLKKLDDLSKL